ncbi:MAG: SiaB family protein kinase [Firmicutes bacterium]|nr:SiaB family protein kinase [Bacillota bacterium]
MAIRETFDILTKPNIKVMLKQEVTANTKASLSTIKKLLYSEELPVTITTAICSVYIELVNNVRMHSAQRKRADAPLGLLLVGRDEDSIYLQSMNIVTNEKVSDIDTKLNRMNSHIKKELRMYYRHRRKFDNPNEESDGAGLGLIEIAKRAKAPVDYEFRASHEGFSLFTMLVVFEIVEEL